MLTVKRKEEFEFQDYCLVLLFENSKHIASGVHECTDFISTENELFTVVIKHAKFFKTEVLNDFFDDCSMIALFLFVVMYN